MATQFAEGLDVKRGDLPQVWPEDLIVNYANRGREFPPSQAAIESLAQSIAESRQLQPVSVTKRHDKQLELIAGFTRYEAIMLLNKQNPDNRRRIECKVISGNPEEMLLANIAENRVRNITTAIDDAHNIRRLTEQFHKTDEEIRKIYASDGYAKSPAWLDGVRKLLRLSKEEQLAIHTGAIKASTGLILADIAPEKREAILVDLKTTGKAITATTVTKAARKIDALKQTSLKAAEIKSVWEFIAKAKQPKLAKLATIVLDWQAGKTPEPDFIGQVKKVLGEYDK
jgi:ParB/RepB/Spo0J family partition protein